MEPYTFYRTFIYILRRTYVKTGVPFALDIPQIEKFWAYGAVFTNVHTRLQRRLLKVPRLPDPRIDI